MADFLGSVHLLPATDELRRRPRKSGLLRTPSIEPSSLANSSPLEENQCGTLSPSSVVNSPKHSYSPSYLISSCFYSSRSTTTSSSSSLVWISLVLALICSLSQVAAIPSNQVSLLFELNKAFLSTNQLEEFMLISFVKISDSHSNGWEGTSANFSSR